MGTILAAERPDTLPQKCVTPTFTKPVNTVRGHALQKTGEFLRSALNRTSSASHRPDSAVSAIDMKSCYTCSLDTPHFTASAPLASSDDLIDFVKPVFSHEAHRGDC